MSCCIGVKMTSHTYDTLLAPSLVPTPTTALSIFSESSPWFAGKMERGQAEQFLMDVSIIVIVIVHTHIIITPTSYVRSVNVYANMSLGNLS